MSISLVCKQCGKLLETLDSNAGSQLVCPSCTCVLTVPILGIAVDTLNSNDPPSMIEAHPESQSTLDNFQLADLKIDEYVPAPTVQLIPQPEAQSATTNHSNYSLLRYILSFATGVVLTTATLGLVWYSFFGKQPSVVSIGQLEAPSGQSQSTRETTNEETSPATQVTDAPPAKDQLPSLEITPETIPQSFTEQTVDDPTAPDQLLSKAKSATAFIKLRTGTTTTFGSGVLVENGLILTSGFDAKLMNGEYTCVFHSGTQNEFSVLASLKGIDATSGLTLLSVRSEKLPIGLELASEVDIREATPVLVLEFSQGDSSNAGDNNPPVAKSSWVVSGVRKDHISQPITLQTERGLMSGNTGGPVFTNDGQLIGLARVPAKDADNIALAIPAKFLADTIRGRPADFKVHQSSATTGRIIFHCQADVIDPMSNISDITAIVTEKQGKLSSSSSTNNGDQEAAASSTTLHSTLNIKGEIATGYFKISDEISKFAVQLKATRKDGTVWYSQSQQVDNAAKENSPSVDVPPDSPDTNIRTFDLPNRFADFAINPHTGEILGVDPGRNVAMLLKPEDYANANESAQKVTVGRMPVSVRFKQFGDLKLFVLVCTQESTMYILKADDIKFIKQVPLMSSGVSSVEVSENTLDPFVYYCYGDERSSYVAAVDLRKMVDRGNVLDSTMDCALSADGQMLYRRGPSSPSGVESLQIRTGFDEAKPIFERLVYFHDEADPYVPDPHGEFTLSGKSIYSKDLTKQRGSIDFVPTCFMKSKPILIGLTTEGQLKMASYNSFNSIGNRLQLPFSQKEIESTTIPSRTLRPSRDNRRRIDYKSRIMVDENRSLIITALGKRICTVPVSSLKPPEEPFLLPKISNTNIYVGSTQTIKIESREPGGKIELSNLPQGATKTDSGFAWNPTSDQVGKTKIIINISQGELNRAIEAEFNVTQPYVLSPIEITRFFVDAKSGRIVCWSGLDEYHGNSYVNQALKENAATPSPRIAILPMKSNEATTTLSLPFPVKQAISSDTRLFVIMENDLTKINVYEISSLKHEESLIASSPINNLRIEENTLQVRAAEFLDVYDLSSLKQIKTFKNDSEMTQEFFGVHRKLLDGVLVNGTLFDASLKTPLLFVLPPTASLEGSAHHLRSGEFLRRTKLANAIHIQASRRMVGQITYSPTGQQVFFERTDIELESSRISSDKRYRLVWAAYLLDADGSPLAHSPIAEEFYSLPIPETRQPHLQVANDAIFMSVGKRIFRWKPKIESSESLPITNSQLHFVPRQEQFLLKAGNSSTLKHVVRGGKPPYRFELPKPINGLSIDQSSGTVTVVESPLIEAGVQKITYNTYGDFESRVTKLQAEAKELSQAIEHRLNVKTSGYPISVPVYVKVMDNEGRMAEIQYFVVVDIPLQRVKDQLQKMLKR